jgi:hypothetical protein
MKRLPVFWVPAPDEEDPEDIDRYIGFTLREEWVCVDDDQLILPISLVERDGDSFDPQPGILKQYGGEGLLNDLLMSDRELEKGTKWVLGHEEGTGRYLSAVGAEDAAAADDD